MKVSNNTRAVVNYNGRAYGPNASFDLKEGDEKIQDIARMLDDGRLAVSLSVESAEKSTEKTAKK